MKFWDSSALVPLLVEQDVTLPLCDLYLRENGVLVWWGTEVECASAIARLEREDRLHHRDATLANQRLDLLLRSWHCIEPVTLILSTARRLLRTHPLRAADSQQLAAALVAAEGRPSTLGFVCLDDRLTIAAEKEGFEVFDRRQLIAGEPTNGL